MVKHNGGQTYAECSIIEDVITYTNSMATDAVKRSVISRWRGPEQQNFFHINPRLTLL